MKYTVFTVSILFLVLTQTLAANSLTYEKCSLKDSECLLKQAQAVLPSLVQGIPELGIKKLDKMHMDKITIDIPGIFCELTNVEIGGLGKAIIDDVSINMPYKLMRISFNTPILFTECDYKLNGTLFGIPVFGEGKGQISLENLQIELLIIFDIVKNEQGDDILEFKSFMYGADAIDGLHSKFENMFNGDKEKSDMYHELVNTNWRLMATNYGRYFTYKIMEKVVDDDPLTYEKCALEDSECIIKQAQAALPSFVQGIPELGIKKLDKLHMDKITIDILNIFSELTNVEIGGLSNAIIDDISINVPYKIMRISFNTDLNTECDYKLNGTLFGFPIFGNGKGHFSLKNLQIEMIIIFDIVKNDQGKDILDFKSYMYGADAIDGLHSHFENMYNGDKEKSDMYHELVNKNWRLIVTNYGRYFTPLVVKEMYEGVKTAMCSRNLEDLALYGKSEK